MDSIALILQGSVIVLGFMFFLWLLHFPLKNAAIVDVGWGLSLGILACFYAFHGPEPGQKSVLQSGMVSIWAIRLSSYLFFTRIYRSPEEGRYKELRRKWAGATSFKFLIFFEAQGLLNIFLSIPFLIIALDPDQSVTWKQIAAAIVWGIGIVGETVADLQLHFFKKKAAHEAVCDVGLWNYSRHPNYFFESLVWISYFLFTVSSPYGIFSAIAPLLILFFLFRVTGIPATEEQALRSRPAAYRQYMKTTSMFVPWFKKSGESLTDRLLAGGLIPDFLIRYGIRSLNRQRLAGMEKNRETARMKEGEFVKALRKSPIALFTGEANTEHYEVPAAFFEKVLGRNLKYSSCYFEKHEDTLDDAEERMLEMTVKRAHLAGGQNILELGCGWGSLSLYMARKFPRSRITAVSNSSSQREFIEKKAAVAGIKNLRVITRDMNDFNISEKFDRIVSVEMFEHMRNYEKLLGKIHSWLKKDGRLFVHIFTHRENPYIFETDGDNDWMARYFFTGGLMPSNHLLFYFNDDMRVIEHNVVNGVHYARTSREWLRNMDANKKSILPVFQQTYGKEYLRWWNYWRVFFMAVEELFATHNGNEWMVNHYLFSKNS